MQFGSQPVRFSAQHRIDQRRKAIVLARRGNRIQSLGIGHSGGLRGRVEIERQLLHLRPREPHVERGTACDPLGQRGVQPDPRRVAKRTNGRHHVAQFGGIEHGDHCVGPLFEQLRSAGLVGGAGGNHDDGTGIPRPRFIGCDQRFERGHRLVAIGAHPDVTRIAEQRCRSRFVAQLRRIAAQFGTCDFYPFARLGKHGHDVVRGRARARLVGAAEEEDRAVARSRLRLARKGRIGELHSACLRSVSATRATMRSAKAPASLSSAVCSAAMTAYSLETTSTPASVLALASSMIVSVAVSTS